MSDEQEPCKNGHDFVFLRSSKTVNYDTWVNIYRRVDYYYCRRCLEQKEKGQEAQTRNEPDWWRAE